ncbi:hypothetical protein [Polyangium sp. 6x1]|uniref:hypothetical protein n=1 Tax=Polyangium sp. 6x1 TaxID=3042689 RepID=UPI002482B35D|nr:hypothetical protein [Polyangium sp. 6x1]MDI1451506.1 hypothetical protein [Polyangium sp. 6x1]
MRKVLSVLAGCGLVALGGCIVVYHSDTYDEKAGTAGAGGAGGPGGASGTGGEGAEAGGACRVEWCFTDEEEASPCPTVTCAPVMGLRQSFASDQDARGIALGKDPQNERIYVAGRFQGSMTIGGTNLMSEGGLMVDDGYVAAFGPDLKGVGAQQLGVPDAMNKGLGLAPRIALGVAFGMNKQVIVGGRFKDTAFELDGFVRAYSDDLMTASWTQTISGPGNDEVVAVGAGASYAYALGSVTNQEGIATDVTIPCVSAQPKTVGVDEKHMVLLAYDVVGNCVWGRRFSGGLHEPRAMTVNNSNDVFITGTYTGNLDGTEMNPAPAQVASAAMFVMKINGATGKVLWFRTYGGEGAGGATPSAITSIVGDALLLTGSTSGVVDLGAGPVVADKDSLFALSLDGATTRWSSIIGGESSAGGVSEGLGIVPSGSGGALVSGTFFATLDFDPQNEGVDITRKAQNAFLVRFDEDGALQWFNPLGEGEAPAERWLPLAMGNNGIYMAMGWQSPLLFENLPIPSGIDIVIAKISP